MPQYLASMPFSGQQVPCQSQTPCAGNIERRKELVAHAQRVFSHQNVRKARIEAERARQRDARHERAVHARGGSSKMEYDMYMDQKQKEDRDAQLQAEQLGQVFPDDPDEVCFSNQGNADTYPTEFPQEYLDEFLDDSLDEFYINQPASQPVNEYNKEPLDEQTLRELEMLEAQEQAELEYLLSLQSSS